MFCLARNTYRLSFALRLPLLLLRRHSIRYAFCQLTHTYLRAPKPQICRAQAHRHIISKLCFLVFSCASLRTLSLRRCVTQVATRDVKPPTADPPKAARTGTEAESMLLPSAGQLNDAASSRAAKRTN